MEPVTVCIARMCSPFALWPVPSGENWIVVTGSGWGQGLAYPRCHLRALALTVAGMEPFMFQVCVLPSFNPNSCMRFLLSYCASFGF